MREIPENVVLCPRCGKNYFTPYGEEVADWSQFALPALSRADNKTYVCSPCGQDEAMRDFFGSPLGFEDWAHGLGEIDAGGA